MQILFIVLRYNAIHKFTSFLATFGNKNSIVGRNQHQRQQTDMIRQSFVFLFIALELFFLLALHATINLLLIFIHSIFSLKHKKLRVVKNILRID